jgi:hypothetical protein
MQKKKAKKKKQQRQEHSFVNLVMVPGDSQTVAELDHLQTDLEAQIDTYLDSKTSEPQKTKTTRQPRQPLPPTPMTVYVMHNLMELQEASRRLARRAEEAGDLKTALNGIKVCQSILTKLTKLVEKHPQLVEDWQPPVQTQTPPFPPDPPAPTAQVHIAPVSQVPVLVREEVSHQALTEDKGEDLPPDLIADVVARKPGWEAKLYTYALESQGLLSCGF